MVERKSLTDSDILKMSWLIWPTHFQYLIASQLFALHLFWRPLLNLCWKLLQRFILFDDIADAMNSHMEEVSNLLV